MLDEVSLPDEYDRHVLAASLAASLDLSLLPARHGKPRPCLRPPATTTPSPRYG
jgi:hypothetical protein